MSPCFFIPQQLFTLALSWKTCKYIFFGSLNYALLCRLSFVVVCSLYCCSAFGNLSDYLTCAKYKYLEWRKKNVENILRQFLCYFSWQLRLFWIFFLSAADTKEWGSLRHTDTHILSVLIYIISIMRGALFFLIYSTWA